MFYAGTKEALIKQIEECFTHEFGPGEFPNVKENGPRNIVGLICPHAGYLYSGPVAAHAYYQLAKDGRPETFIVLGPNHTGRGSALSIVNEGVWQTPLGNVKVNTEVANKILQESNIIDLDYSAHEYEHSIEVQLPFIQHLYGKEFDFVPICFRMQDLETSCEVGRAIAKALIDMNVLVVASTDMTHYEPQERAELKDKKAINTMINLDEEQLYSIVESYKITMCGYGPVIALIVASKELGAKKSRLLSYKTSGNVTGDLSAVVGYASISIIK